MKKTYLVFFDGKFGKKPKKHHDTIHSAMTEAERISKKSGERILIVEVFAAVTFVEGERLIEIAE